MELIELTGLLFCAGAAHRTWASRHQDPPVALRAYLSQIAPPMASTIASFAGNAMARPVHTNRRLQQGLMRDQSLCLEALTARLHLHATRKNDSLTFTVS